MLNIKFFSQRVLSTIILNTLVVVFVFGGDYKANTVTNTDKEALKRLDEKLYKLVNKTAKKDDQLKNISDFIYKNLRYDLDYSRLTVTASASGTSATVESFSGETNKNKLRAGITFSYPLFDPKENNERKKTIIAVKQKISADVKAYLLLEAKIHDLEIALLIQQQLEIRAKARKLEGVGGFDDWLKIIQEIKKIQEDLAKSTIEKQEAREILLSYIEESRQNLLLEVMQ
jgi:hypothetical protein